MKKIIFLCICTILLTNAVAGANPEIEKPKGWEETFTMDQLVQWFAEKSIYTTKQFDGTKNVYLREGMAGNNNTYIVNETNDFISIPTNTYNNGNYYDYDTLMFKGIKAEFEQSDISDEVNITITLTADFYFEVISSNNNTYEFNNNKNETFPITRNITGKIVNQSYAILNKNTGTADTYNLTFYCNNEQETDWNGKCEQYIPINLNNYDNSIWRDNIKVDISKIKYVTFDQSVQNASPKSCKEWFYQFSNLKSIEGLTYLNTTDVKNMTRMFAECDSLRTLDLYKFNTYHVLWMKEMFKNCTSIVTIFAGNDFSPNMVKQIGDNGANMFEGCYHLISTNEWVDEKDPNTWNATYYNPTTNKTTLYAASASGGYFTSKYSSTGEIRYYVLFDQSIMSIDGSSYTPTYQYTKNYGEEPDWCFPEIQEDDGYELLGYELQLTKYNTGDTIFPVGYHLTKTHGEGNYRVNVIWGEIKSYAVYDKKAKTLHIKYDGRKEIYEKNTSDYAVFDLNAANTKPAWREDPYLTEIEAITIDNEIKPDACNWFQGCTNLKSVTGFKNLKLDNITNLESLFEGCSKLENLDDIKDLDVSGVYNMQNMFSNCSSLQKLDLSGWSLRTSTPGLITFSMFNMFGTCSNLESITFGTGFNTQAVASMSHMFQGCINLKVLDLSSFSFEKIQNMSGMFMHCTKLTTILVNADNWESSYVQHFGTDDEKEYDKINNIFYNCRALIGNSGALAEGGTDITEYHPSGDFEHINTGADGFLTKGNFKIFIDLNDNEKQPASFKETTPFEYKNEKKEIKTVPTRTGYVFQGWEEFLNAKKTETTVDSTFSSDLKEIISVEKGSGNKIFRAKWEEHKISVTLPDIFEITSTTPKPKTIKDKTAIYSDFTYDTHITFNLASALSPDDYTIKEVKLTYTTPAEVISDVLTLSEKGFYQFDLPDYDVVITATYIEKGVFNPGIKMNEKLGYNTNKQKLIEYTQNTSFPILFKVNDGEYSQNLPEATDAGDYTIWYKSDPQNTSEQYLPISETSLGTVTIAPQKISVTYVNPNNEITKLYDGNTSYADEQKIDLVTDFVLEPDNTKAEIVSGTLQFDGANVGSHKVSFKAKLINNEKGNYVLTNDNIEIDGTITPAKIDLTNDIPINYIITEKTYDTKADLKFTNNSFEYNTGIKSEKVTIKMSGEYRDYSGEPISDAIEDYEYRIFIKPELAEKNANYVVEPEWIELKDVVCTIKPAIISIPDLPINTSKTYDGTALVYLENGDALPFISNNGATSYYTVNDNITITHAAYNSTDVATANQINIIGFCNNKNYQIGEMKTIEGSITAKTLNIDSALTAKELAGIYTNLTKNNDGNNTIVADPSEITVVDADLNQEVTVKVFDIVYDNAKPGINKTVFAHLSSNNANYTIEDKYKDGLAFSTNGIISEKIELSLNKNIFMTELSTIGKHIWAKASGNGIDSIPGTYTYSPAQGTELKEGTHKITVTFVPNNQYSYFNNAEQTFTVDVYDKVIVEDNKINQETHEQFCAKPLGNIQLNFTTLYGEPTFYSIVVEKLPELSQYGNVTPDGDNKYIIELEVPSKTVPGIYQGYITFFADEQLTAPISEQLEFTITVNIPKNIIKQLYENVLFVDNHDELFVSYQWVKNDEKISESQSRYANRQFYFEKELKGVYSVLISTKSGIELKACPVDSEKDLTKTLRPAVNVYPNPAKAGQPFTLQISGTSNSNARIIIFNNSGIMVHEITMTENSATISLPRGIYSGALIYNNEKIGFKLIVE